MSTSNAPRTYRPAPVHYAPDEAEIRNWTKRQQLVNALYFAEQAAVVDDRCLVPKCGGKPKGKSGLCTYHRDDIRRYIEWSDRAAATNL